MEAKGSYVEVNLAHSYVEVSLVHSYWDLAYFLITPTLEIDGTKERKAWGVHRIELPPGDHELSVSYPSLMSREAGKSSVRFRLLPGEVKKVEYRSGPIRYLPGKMTVTSVL